MFLIALFYNNALKVYARTFKHVLRIRSVFNKSDLYMCNSIQLLKAGSNFGEFLLLLLF